MKILVNCPLPFALAHGGHQIQIQRTLAALEAVGVQAEPVRWWDEKQTGDLIHYFGRMPVGHIKLAHQKGIKVIIAELLTEQGSRSALQLRLQKIISNTLERLAPGNFVYAFNWESYRLADACIALTPWEADIMHSLFGAPKETHSCRGQRGRGNFFEFAKNHAREMARLHRHHHRAQARFGTGPGRRPRANTGLDHRTGLRRFRPLRATIFRAGKTTSANHPP